MLLLLYIIITSLQGGYTSLQESEIQYLKIKLSSWMELEGIMLSEVSQSEKDKHYMFSFIWGI